MKSQAEDLSFVYKKKFSISTIDKKKLKVLKLKKKLL